MSGLLAVERSATLRHLLERTLEAGDLNAIQVAQSYEECKGLLRRASQDHSQFEALLVGAPTQQDEDFSDLLSFLSLEENLNLPLLMVAHEQRSELRGWLQDRQSSRLVLWSDFSRIPSAVKRLAPSARLNGSASAAEDPQQVRILFVDDSQSVRYAYQKLLKSEGYPVQVAGSIAEAMDMARSDAYDLIIVDYFLPDGNGDELCRHLKEDPHSADASVAIITGTYRESVIKKCLDAGAVECMFKNEAKELFLTRVRAVTRAIDSQKSVEAERERLQSILGSVGDGVFGVDVSGRISFINQVGLEMLGFDGENDLVGRQAHGAFHFASAKGELRAESECKLHQTYAAGTRLSAYETVFWHQDKRPVPVECNVSPLTIARRREGSVVVFRDISERKDAEQLRWEITHDPLTKVGNRRFLTQALEKNLDSLRESGGYDALLYLDIDRFNQIKESASESVAEGVLADVAAKLATRLREHDEIARIGTDSFGVLLKGVQLSNLFNHADAFRELMGHCEYPAYEQVRSVSASIGVTVLSADTPSAEYALESARVACYDAKNKGRDQTHIALGEDTSRIARELDASWSQRFKEALENDRFLFLAQPIVSTDVDIPLGSVALPKDWRLMMAESLPPKRIILELLLRMVSRDGQWVSPGVFVPLAERVNMIDEIDLWVIRNAIKRLEKLNEQGFDVAFCINVSTLTLQDPEALGLVRDAIEGHNIHPGQLIFEITETSEMENVHHVRRFLTKLRKLGVRFALDDFGTGFSSFSHLKHLPVDFVKIDGLFVESMTISDVDRTMVNSINEMAHSLGLQTIAEHVDSEANYRAVGDVGTDLAQGNYLGEPVPLENIDFSFLG